LHPKQIKSITYRHPLMKTKDLRRCDLDAKRTPESRKGGFGLRVDS
jgi:hypothetical protein